MSDDIKQLAAIEFMNKMMRGGHFSICTVDEIAKMFGINPDPEAYRILRTLHCVDFSAMDRALYASIPALIQSALDGNQIFEFQLKPRDQYPALSTIIESAQRPKNSLVQRLFGVQP